MPCAHTIFTAVMFTITPQRLSFTHFAWAERFDFGNPFEITSMASLSRFRRQNAKCFNIYTKNSANLGLLSRIVLMVGGL